MFVLAKRTAVEPAVEALSQFKISLIMQLVFVQSPVELWNLRITLGSVDMFFLNI